MLNPLRVGSVLPLLLSASLSLSQSRQVDFDRLSIRDGLSQATVFSILQDREGFMWFGTADGLNKFDGYSFTHFRYDVKDSTSLSDNRIIALLEDMSGRLWVGTIGGGLNLFERESATFRRYQAGRDDNLGLSDNRVNSLFQDSQGIVWVGTTVAGVDAFDPRTGVFRHFRHNPDDTTSLSSNHVFPIVEDQEGYLWIGTPEGINLLDRNTGKVRRIHHHPDDPLSLSHDYINALHCDRSGTVWVGTVNGLNRLTGYDTVGTEVRPRFMRYLFDPDEPRSLASNTVWAIYEDASGALWVGTDGGGLNLLNRRTDTFERYLNDLSDARSLSDNSVRSIFQDKSGTLWVGTNVGGLSTWNPRRKKFTTFSVWDDSMRSISSNWIHAIWEDHLGKVWIGSSAQMLDILDRSSGLIRHFPTGGTVEALYEDTSRQQMWMGSRAGLFTVDLRSLRFRKVVFRSPDPDTLSSGRVRVLEADQSGDIWVGFFQRGIAVVHPEDGSMTHYLHDSENPGSLSNNRVRAIRQDHAGVMWIGTYGGLDRFEAETRRFVHYRHNPADLESISNDNVLSIFDFPRDSGKVLWVGTLGGGLNRLDTRTGRFTRYTTDDGLPNNVVYGILGDKTGRLWITTNRGMARLDPGSGGIRIFDVSDGLQGSEFATGAYHMGRGGVMFVGGVSGFSSFHPDSIKESTFIPPAVITSVRILGRPSRVYVSPVELGPGDKYITFDFAVLDYADPAKNRYAYRLRGFDDRWSISESQRSAAFTNLDPGEYVFEVKGSNSDGVWNEDPVAFRVVVVPPFWKTWWFVSLSIAAVLLLAYGIYRRRLAAQIEKARIVNELQAARSVQLGLLPGVDPHIDGLDISGVCIPAMEVGGDFFEYLDFDPERSRLTLAMGDVSGKGMNAAMTAVMAIGMLHRESEIATSPATMLRHINTTLFLKTDKRLFVAMVLASFDGSSRKMKFANGGLSMPIRRRRGVLKTLTGNGVRFPLGVREHTEYEDCTLALQPGDVLVFMTDGVAEARNSDGEFFGEARVERVIRELPLEITAREMVRRIVTAVQEFTGDQQLHDDVTVVVTKAL